MDPLMDLEYFEFLQFIHIHSDALVQHLHSKLDKEVLINKAAAGSTLHKNLMMIWTVVISDALSISNNKEFKNVSVLGEDVAGLKCKYIVWLFVWAIQSLNQDIQILVPLMLAPEHLSLVSSVSNAIDGNFEQITHLNLVSQYPAWIKNDARYSVSLLNKLRTLFLNGLLPKLQESAITNSALILRAYCTIEAAWGIQLDISEIECCLSIGQKSSGFSVNQFFTTFLILVADQAFILCKDKFKNALHTILKSDHSEFSHIIGVYFYTDQPAEIKKLLAGTLGMPCPIRNESYSLLCKFFLEEVFTKQKLAETALALVNKKTNVVIGIEDLSISLTYNMLKAKIFHSTGTNLQRAIYLLIHQAQDGTQGPLLPSLLKLYCESSFDSTGPFSKLPIETSHILHTLNSTGSHVAEQSLLCFCIFYHRHQWYSKEMDSFNTYTDEFVDNLHLRPILDFAEEHVNASPLYAQLVALIFAQCPEYYDPTIYLDTQIYATPFDLIDSSIHAQIQSPLGNVTYETFDKLILVPDGFLLRSIITDVSKQEENVIKILKMLYRKHARQVFPLFDTLLLLLVHVLQKGGSKTLYYWIKQTWLRMLRYHPQLTFTKTMSKLNDMPNLLKRSATVQAQDNSSHIQEVLKFGIVFVQTVGLLPIFLHLVNISALLFSTKIKRAKVLNEAQKNSVLLAKDAIIFQSLMKLCDSGPEMKESVQELCLFIHQIFVNQVGSLRLVHFQGYDSKLIPLAVEHIPSLHVVTDLIPDLLIEPITHDRFVFTIILASHLFAKYPLEKSLIIAKDLVLPAIIKWSLPLYRLAETSAVSSTKGGLSTGQSTSDYASTFFGLTEIMPSLVTLGFAFPVLLDPIAKLLSDLEMLLRKTAKNTASQNLELAVMKTLAGIASDVIHSKSGLNKSLM
ncbi:Integrator complex subunit 2 [Batrachochytrium dendrobatidis]|nr:Integrator complex subunit 2 [Batrachochytrium dendrobatidis]